MELSYLAWSTLNWFAFSMAAIYFITTALSILLDFVGRKKESTIIYFKGLSLVWLPCLIVGITRWLGFNNGFFP